MTNQEAIEIYKDLWRYEHSEFSEKEIREALEKGIEALEKQKIGHWIRWYEEVEYKTCTEHIPHCKCSECNKEYDPHTSLFMKYCSYCGAKMEGE